MKVAVHLALTFGKPCFTRPAKSTSLDTHHTSCVFIPSPPENVLSSGFQADHNLESLFQSRYVVIEEYVPADLNSSE
jgi:hypothetical protein